MKTIPALCLVANGMVAASSMVGCYTPHLMTPQEMTDLNRAEAEKRYRAATDPDVRLLWKGAVECSVTPISSVDDMNRNAKSPFNFCLAEKGRAQVVSVHARAETEVDSAARDHSLRVATCVELTYAGDFSPYKTIEDCFSRAPIKAEYLEAISSRSAYAEAEKADSPEGWLRFLEAHGKDPRAPAVANRILLAAAQKDPDAQFALDEKLLATSPTVSDMPVARHVLFVGPPGLRVREIQKMRDAKVATNVIVARVRASGQPYKTFDGDELAALKQIGISDDVVTAMLEVTTKLDDRKRENDERQALRNELAALKAMIEQKQASGGAAGNGQVIQTSEGAMDVLASCAKRLGAMKACESIPFPGGTICKSAAESSFPCPKN